MRKENLISLVIIVPLLFASACKDRDLNRKKAEKLLTNHLKEILMLTEENNCKFVNNDFVRTLAEAPEFTQLKDVHFCATKLIVTGIRRVSEDMALVEYEINYIYNYDKKYPQKILLGLEALQSRWAFIQPIKRHRGEYYLLNPWTGQRTKIYVWDFKDSITGNIIETQYVDNNKTGDIKNTLIWSRLERAKNHYKHCIADNTCFSKRENDKHSEFFMLYDDGWRVSEKIIKGKT